MRAHDGDMFDDETDNAADNLFTELRGFLEYIENTDKRDTVVLGYAERMQTALDQLQALLGGPKDINVITNAPPAYDYESTVLRTVNVPGHTKFKDMNSQSPFRLVALDPREGGYYAEYQQNRYKSGGYLVLTPETWDEWRNDGTIIGGYGEATS